MADEGLDVTRFVIRGAVLPAAPEDADPFEGESAQDGLVMFAGAFSLEVIRFGPRAFGDGLAGPLCGCAKEASFHREYRQRKDDAVSEISSFLR